MRHQVQLKGLIRFSYLSENGFSKSSRGVNSARELLYDPARLDRRFRLFEHLALHSLSLQDDPDFSIAILIGDSLPDKARARLEDLVSDFKQARIVALPPMIHIQAIKKALAALPNDKTKSHVANFRQDDDDAMHRGTLARIRKVADHMLSLRENEKPFAIAFNRGLYLDPTAAKPIREWYERTPLGIGLTLVSAKGERGNVFRRNHRQLMQYYDCYSEVAQPMWIRSVHQDNDSSAAATGRPGTLREKGIRQILKSGFELTPEILDAL